MFKIPQNILLTIVISKLVYILIILLTSLIVVPFDQNTDILLTSTFYSSHSNHVTSKLDTLLKNLLSGFIRWDAVYFVNIATDGYRFEQLYAFFPLLPLVMRCGSKLLFFLPNVSEVVKVALVGIVFTNTCHVLSSILLYNLTKLLFRSRRLAAISSLIYIWNPANAVLSSIYSEAPFAMFSFAGLLCFYNKKRYSAAMNWALASLLRSNGIILIGFFWYDFLLFTRLKPKNVLRFLLANLIRSLIVLSGFTLFLAHGYYSMCVHSERPWCHQLFPNIYSFVQEHYWNVGFLRYYTWGNIPNFILAIPMITLSIFCITSYVLHDPKRLFFLRNTINHEKHSLFLNQDQLVPHILLLSFMLVYIVLGAHIQIITRVFSFMPIISWYLAELCLRGIKWPLYVFCGYGLVNSVLFAAYYPPA